MAGKERACMLRKELNDLIESVLKENLRLNESGLVVLTFGNVSAIDRERSVVAIKPSGVPYGSLTAGDIVLCDMKGNTVESALRPSSDLLTHLALYRAFPGIGGIVHTHSTFATAFAQARLCLPCMGTTHADFFRGEVPVTDSMSPEEISGDYEANTGAMIVRKFADLDIMAQECPAVLVSGHGPFCWGDSPSEAVENAVALEEISRIAWLTFALSADARPIEGALLDKHFFRKHGKNSYYGQKNHE